MDTLNKPAILDSLRAAHVGSSHPQIDEEQAWADVIANHELAAAAHKRRGGAKGTAKDQKRKLDSLATDAAALADKLDEVLKDDGLFTRVLCAINPGTYEEDEWENWCASRHDAEHSIRNLIADLQGLQRAATRAVSVYACDNRRGPKNGARSLDGPLAAALAPVFREHTGQEAKGRAFQNFLAIVSPPHCEEAQRKAIGRATLHTEYEPAPLPDEREDSSNFAHIQPSENS